jgi:5-methylcytosine-specific restriction enzyme A
MQQPLCESCLQHNVVTAATECHHVPPHGNDWWAFLHNPLMSLCKSCHSQRQRDANAPSRPKRVIGFDGLPIG